MKKLLLILIILTMNFNLEANIFNNLFKGNKKNVEIIEFYDDITANNVIKMEIKKANYRKDIYIISFYFENETKFYLILDKKGGIRFGNQEEIQRINKKKEKKNEKITINFNYFDNEF